MFIHVHIVYTYTHCIYIYIHPLYMYIIMFIHVHIVHIHPSCAHVHHYVHRCATYIFIILVYMYIIMFIHEHILHNTYIHLCVAVFKLGIVVAELGQRNVYSVSAAERGKTHTILFCVSACGFVIHQ